jgi:ATP-binding cassette subfamily B protein
VVGEQGFSLSGGQRQRIAIARAILLEPRILILDDATSSVDARMEEEIRSALREVMQDRTTVIISHRLSTISLADQVVLVDEGRVAATGTHAELMRTSARYREVLGQMEAAVAS